MAKYDGRMTPAEFAAALPNGFHDAFLRELRVDFTRGEATLSLVFWIGSLDAPAGPLREARKAGVLRLTGLSSIVTEAPAPGSRPVGKDGLWIDGDFGVSPGEPPPPDDGQLRLWFFVQERNSFMRFAAKAAALEW